MAECTGKFKLASSDNFDEYLKAIGVNMIMRKMATSSTPTVEITADGDEYTIKTSGMKELVNKFKLGVEQDETTADGRKVKSTYTKDGNKLVQIEKGDKESKIVRDFSNGQLTVTMTVDNVSSVRKYAPL